MKGLKFHQNGRFDFWTSCSKNQLESTSILAILYFVFKIPVLPLPPSIHPSPKWLYDINHLVEGGLECWIEAFFLPFSSSIIIMSLALINRGLSFPLYGRRGGLMVSALDSGSDGPGSNPGWGINCGSWARHFTLIVPLFTWVYK